MESIKKILKDKFKDKQPVHAKYEFQEYGIWLSQQLHDSRHKSLYIKLAKEKTRASLQEAMMFAIGYNTSTVNRGKLFMWKLTDLEKERKAKRSQKRKSPVSSTED
jgi:hypothetical protein